MRPLGKNSDTGLREPEAAILRGRIKTDSFMYCSAGNDNAYVTVSFLCQTPRCAAPRSGASVVLVLLCFYVFVFSFSRLNTQDFRFRYSSLEFEVFKIAVLAFV